MIFIDTNVLSEIMRPNPDKRVLGWVNGLRRNDVGITAISVAEILYGIGSLPAGRKKHHLLDAATAMFDEYFSGRIYAFDQLAAIEYADIVIQRERMGTPISMPDAQIAAICRVSGADFATRNTKDFENTGLVLIDPWET
jgi:predicted nucleic acid-binding protein